ncbi:MAG TPA: GH25 family lysozyme [Gaiellaceae bacterium]|nr:GH25 family lysozyme [Gaiellaceae bacterium]
MGVRILVALAIVGALAGPAGAATYANGVDVSHYQGLINWTQVAAKSYRFTFAKATEGTTLVDATYPVNRAGAEGMGMRFGAYHFGRPSGTGPATINASAIAQADHFVDVAQPQAGELPPVLDLEATGGLSAKSLVQWAQAWLDEVKARTGVSGFVYASPNFWKDRLGNTSAFALGGYRLWVAHWTKNGAPSVPAENWGGLGWTFWQWTDCASVPGFLNCVDGDRYAGLDPGPIAIPAYPTGAPVASVPPTVVGTVKVGMLLVAVPGTWSGGKPIAFTYQWQQCDAAGSNCTPISGATSDTYKPTTADSGHALIVTVTSQSSSGGAAAASAPTVAVGSSGSGVVTRPVATTQPSIAGDTIAGQQLVSSVGTWTGSPTSFTYQWRRCDPAGITCDAITGATDSTYVLSPGDIGATLSLVVTATSAGGSQTATTPATGLVAAAPVPTPVPGALAAASGEAGAVVTTDGRAQVTWQPGAVPDGSTVTLLPGERSPALKGTGVVVGVSDISTLLPWPIDLTYANPLPDGSVLAYTVDNTVWHALAVLASPALPAGSIAGTYNDGTTLHVILSQPMRIAAFAAGHWGDPSLVAEELPTVYRNGPLTVKRLSDGSLIVRTRVTVASQAHLFVGLAGGVTKESLLLRPGSVPIVVRIRHLKAGVTAHLRVAAVDPFKRRAALLIAFRVP